ncbi:MAG: glycoside hydrolase family 25 protein [Bauldia sp.]|jgi:lysozyme|nr:glycoside hydrolase family 25 protein [Bauldia sp.]
MSPSLRFLRYALPVVVLLVAGTAGGYITYRNYEPDRTRYPVRGIDVSHHQGTIDWQRVAADDVAFVFMKATEGGDHLDTEFARNLEGAREAGLAVGAYHFFTFCRPGADQAANFLATVPDEATDLPPVVDLEYAGNCDYRPTEAELAVELQAFLAPVEARFGREVVYYATEAFLADYGDAIPARQLWRRSIAWEPDTPDWIVWQYHNAGTVDGISGPVDLNVLNGELAGLVVGR